ncbi:MAG: hypothetical protein ACXITV_01345 [Luteibaculaceae bacterium]
MDKIYDFTDKVVSIRNSAFEVGYMLQFNCLIHSCLNTIELDSLLDNYLNSKISFQKSFIESNIKKRLKNQTTKSSEELYERIIQGLQNSDYHKRQRTRNLLRILLPFLKSEYSIDFFNTFINSKYKYDIAAAIEVLNKDWDIQFDQTMYKYYLATRRENILKKYLDNASDCHILNNLREFWNHEISDYLKTRLIRRYALSNFEVFEFIRESEPEKYLLAMTLSDKLFSKEDLWLVYYDIPEYIKPLGILALSKVFPFSEIEGELRRELIKIQAITQSSKT